jgi:phenylacetate-CoA ligase
MNRNIETIYYRLPVFIQDMAVSLYGLKLRSERFEKAGQEMLKLLEGSKHFTQDKIIEYQEKEFVALAKHAIATTSFYQRWAAENNITAEDIKSLKDIQRFPIIEKTYLRQHAAEFRSQDPTLTQKQFVLHTSGTTGSPLSVYTDKESRSRHYAFFSRLRHSHGLNANSKRATLFGRMIMLAAQDKPPFWRNDFFQNNLLMSSYHLSEKNLAHYYKKLREYQPEEIFAYPSSIFALASYINKNKLPKIHTKLVMTTAENLTAAQSEAISQAFDGVLINQYGCTEMAFFCSGQPGNAMLFEPEHGLVEVRKTTGETSDQGIGELVATGFINYSMPVIRYLVGDLIELGERNSQGRQQLLSVMGRTDDIIYTKSGTPVGRLDPIFKGGSGITLAQIIQEVDGNISLNIVPDADYQPQHGQNLTLELIKRLGTDVRITVNLVAGIEKSKNGKFRPVISKFKPNTP